MGRIRSIKPEFPQSESVGRLSREARLLFLQLFTIVDDEGRTRGHTKLIAATLYPYDDDVMRPMEDYDRTTIGLPESSSSPPEPYKTPIESWLQELEREKMIVRYDNGGTRYIQVAKWKEHQQIQKPSKSRIPCFTDKNSVIVVHQAQNPVALQEHSDRTTGTLPEGYRADLGSRILDLGSRIVDHVCVLEDSTHACATHSAPEPSPPPPTQSSTHKRSRDSQEFFRQEFFPESHRTPEVQAAWHAWLNYVLDRDGRLVPAAVDAWAMDAARREPTVAAERLRESVSRLAPSGPYWTELTGSRAGPGPKVDPMDELREKLEAAKKHFAEKSKEALNAI